MCGSTVLLQIMSGNQTLPLLLMHAGRITGHLAGGHRLRVQMAGQPPNASIGSTRAMREVEIVSGYIGLNVPSSGATVRRLNKIDVDRLTLDNDTHTDTSIISVIFHHS